MKKIYVGAIICLLLNAWGAQAQNTAEVQSFPYKSPRFAVAGQGIYNGNPYPGQVGVSLDTKMFVATNHANADAYNEYVVTIKGIHTFPTDGPTYGSFDKGLFDNISALLILGGYRFNFGQPAYMTKDYRRDSGGWFLELNAGGAYYRYAKTLRFAISPMVGYSISKHVDLVGSYTGTWINKKGKYPITALGLGAQFNF